MLDVERAEADLIEKTAATSEERRHEGDVKTGGRRQRAILLEWLTLSRYEHIAVGNEKLRRHQGQY